MSPEGKIVEAPKNPHSTYPMHMQGEYFGGLEVPIDYKNMFSTFYEPKRLFGVKDPQAYRAYSLSAPIQEFDQKWLDEVMPIYQQQIKDITGRKKGGEVTQEKDYRSLINEILSKEGYANGGRASRGKRLDNTEKETGFLGEIPTPRGEYMTEMSVGEPNTDELFRPSIVPNTHPAEINYMIQTGEVPTDLYPISQRHAEKRIAEGKSPFWNEKEDVNKIRDMIKSILGSDVEKADGGSIADDAEEYGQQLKEQRKTLGSDILKTGAKGITEGVGNILRSAKETLSRAGTIGDIVENAVFDPIAQKARYESVTGKKFPELKPISLLPNQAITESPVDAKILPFTTEGQQLAGEVIGDPLSYSVSGAGRGIEKFGKFVGKGLAEQVQTGKGIIGRNIVNPRANILPEHGINLGVDFFRPSEDTIRGHKMDAMPGSQWYSWLQSNAPKSSKKELETSGTMNWLKDSKDKISKTDIINHVRENEPNLRSKTYSSYETHPYEVIGDPELGNYDVVDSSMGDTVISSHGDQGDAYMAMEELANEMYPMSKYKQYTLPGGEEYREIVIQDKPKVWSKENKFSTQHYPEATNPIAHLRVNHRDDANGNPTLFIEELQSDWAQRGKKKGFGKQAEIKYDPGIEAYRAYDANGDMITLWNGNEYVTGLNSEEAVKKALQSTSYEKGIPHGPYVEDTKDWTALALKQAIKEAVDNGKTQVAWTTGAQQADRYDLSKQLSRVKLMPDPLKGDKLKLVAYDHNDNRVINEVVEENNIDEYIGKDLANKLLQQEPLNTPGLTKDELDEFARLHNFREKGTISDTGKARLQELKQKDNDSLNNGVRKLEGLDIKVGGEGMQGYYDKIVPQVANDVIKQLGGKNKVKVIKFGDDRRSYEEIQDMLKDFDKYPENSAERKALREEQKTAPDYGQHEHRGDQLGFEITPEMIKFIKEEAGIPKFKKGGSIDLQQEYKLENMRRRYG
jgi:hypothetical protein